MLVFGLNHAYCMDRFEGYKWSSLWLPKATGVGHTTHWCPRHGLRSEREYTVREQGSEQRRTAPTSKQKWMVRDPLLYLSQPAFWAGKSSPLTKKQAKNIGSESEDLKRIDCDPMLFSSQARF